MGSRVVRWNSNLVSVVMPAYFSEATISGAIDSVIDQTYTNWELLIYDDCSGDGTLDLVEKYARNDARIRVVVGNENHGVASARNIAIVNAKGRYISFLDSDDKWKPNKLQMQLDYINKNNCDICYSSYDLIDSKGRDTGKKINIPQTLADYKSLLKNNYIGTLTVMIDRMKVGNIQFRRNRHEDFLLWLSFVSQGYKIMGITESLAKYRVSYGSLSGNKIKAAVWRWKVYYKIEKLGLFHSLYYMVVYTFNSIVKRI